MHAAGLIKQSVDVQVQFRTVCRKPFLLLQVCICSCGLIVSSVLSYIHTSTSSTLQPHLHILHTTATPPHPPHYIHTSTSSTLQPHLHILHTTATHPPPPHYSHILHTTATPPHHSHYSHILHTTATPPHHPH